MKKSIVIKIVVGAVLLPLASLFLTSKFNLFSYLDFIPKDYQYEAGLGCYFAILDAIYEYVVYRVSQNKIKITFVFYRVKSEMNICNVPTIIFGDSDNSVATFNCNIRLEGNIKRLRKIKIQLPLPPWVTSQVSKDDELMTYDEMGITWDFSNALPSDSEYQQQFQCTSKVSLIKSQSENSLSITAKPQLEKNCIWEYLGIEFEANEIIIKNME